MNSDVQEYRQVPQVGGRRKRALTLAFGVSLGAAAVLAFPLLRTWWCARQDEAIARALLQNNPGVAENERLIEAAVAASDTGLEAAPTPVVEREEANPSAPAGAGEARLEPDAAWKALPRTGFRLPAALKDRSLLVAESLFRNAHLNPRDVVIPIPDRAAFASWLGMRADSVCNLRDAVTAVSQQELDYMIDHDMARSVSYSELYASYPPEKKKAIEESNRELRASLEAAGATPAEIERAIAEQKVFEPTVVVGDAITGCDLDFGQPSRGLHNDLPHRLPPLRLQVGAQIEHMLSTGA